MNKKLSAVLLAGTILFGSMSPSFAYYSKTDYAETFEIKSNQSAFLIPMQGANQSTQAKFGSEDYYTANKVATKRIQIPHTKLPNSGYTSDYYIPAAKLVIVDRTPFNREWSDASTKGTSARPEGFHFESGDSINIETDITIAASVSEDNAAKFLYHFGVKPTANPVAYDPTKQYQSDEFYGAQYASVDYGYSLSEVMDTLGRGEIQQLLANQFAKYKLLDAISKKQEIMAAVTTEATKWFADRGITLEYVGFANSLNYDEKVQTAMNNVVSQTLDAQALNAMAPAMAVRQQIAEIKITESLAAALAKWNGQLPALPSFMFLPDNVVSFVTNFLKPAEPTTTKLDNHTGK